MWKSLSDWSKISRQPVGDQLANSINLSETSLDFDSSASLDPCICFLIIKVMLSPLFIKIFHYEKTESQLKIIDI